VSQHRIDGQQPLAVASAGTSAEVAAVLRYASESGLSVLLRGAGRQMQLGGVPGPVGLLVSLARLNAIVDFDHENLTVTAEAGTTLEALQQAAAQRGQMLPLDPAGGDGASIGGIAATNLAGPLRMRYGPPRDLIIGLRVAFSDGTIVKTGGKTVKNVAGYELTKLFVGSFGTLAAICEVTVRLTPLPEVRAMVAAALSADRAREVCRELLASRLEIACLDVCNRAGFERMRLHPAITVEADSRVLLAGLLGDRATVERQERELRQMLGGACATLTGEPATTAWGASRECTYPRQANDVVVRAAAPLAEAAGLLQDIAGSGGWWALARSGDGIVYAGAPAAASPDDIVAKLRAVRSAAEAAGGFAVLESGAPDLKRIFGVWGEGTNVDLMRKLKESYDPRGTLGCGRYLPGR
jgi:glycolate oxidase FAD binding subunit